MNNRHRESIKRGVYMIDKEELRNKVVAMAIEIKKSAEHKACLSGYNSNGCPNCGGYIWWYLNTHRKITMNCRRGCFSIIE